MNPSKIVCLLKQVPVTLPRSSTFISYFYISVIQVWEEKKRKR